MNPQHTAYQHHVSRCLAIKTRPLTYAQFLQRTA